MERVRKEMTTRVTFVTEQDSLTTAYELLRSLEVNHLPVLRDGKVVGILSDRDILLHSDEKDGMVYPKNKTVQEVSTKPVLMCQAENTIAHAADLMLENRIHCLPVVDVSGSLVGIITSSDLIRLLRKQNGILAQAIPLNFDQAFRMLFPAVQ